MVQFRYTRFLDSVQHYFALAKPMAKNANDSVSIFWIHKNMGDAYEHHQYLDSTLQYYEICEGLIPSGNYSLKSFLLGDKAYTYQLLYDYEKSTQLSLQALDAAYLAGDSTMVANNMLSVASDFSFLKMAKQATLYHQKAIRTSANTGNSVMIEYSLRGYGKYLVDSKDWQQAYGYLKKAEKLAATNSDSISMAFNWFHLSNYFWKAKQFDSCFYFGKKAEKLWEFRVENIDLSHVCHHLGKCYLQLNRIDEATYYLQKAERLALADPYFNENLFSTLADLFSKKNNAAMAYKYMCRAKELSQEIREREASAKLAGLQIQYQTAQKEKQFQAQLKETERAKNEVIKSIYQRNSILLVTLVLLLFSVVAIYLNRKINIKNHQLSVTNAALLRTTEQKQLLLKEVHHRVKNNLTTLKSLFYLQAKNSTNQSVKEALEECQQQIHSMALIHQTMYEATENKQLDFFGFLQQLISELKHARGSTETPIEITYQGESVAMDVSIALFLGLMVNELATNSFKHAFVGRSHGAIHVSLSNTSSATQLKFIDDGIGLSRTFQSTNGNFGFKLLHIMADQIQSTIRYERYQGNSIFSIEIPHEKQS